MKKTSICLFLIITSLSIFAQKPKPVTPAPDMPMDTTTKLITYTEVVQMPAANAQELFKRAKKWVYGFYKSPSSVIQTLDSTNYIFVGKTNIIMVKTLKDGTKSNNSFINYTITINLKDGKYRYKITNFNMKDASYHAVEKFATEKDPETLDWDNQMLRQTDDYIKDLIGKLKTTMSKPSNEVKNDNW